MQVILDLDETLINSQPLDELTINERKRFMRRFTTYNMDGYYLVSERPYLQPFLDYVFANHKVSVWTAASRDYANFIIKNIILTKPDRKLEFFFWDRHCKVSKKKFKNPKKLDLLWDVYKCGNFRNDNTFIIDDLDDVYKTQKCNSIPVLPPFDVFDNSSDGDRFLQKLIPKLKKMKLESTPYCLTNHFHSDF